MYLYAQHAVVYSKSFALCTMHTLNNNNGQNMFFCTPCSRQFGHRVKGISMSTFTAEEVEALKNGGNQVSFSPLITQISSTVSFPR